MSVNMTILMGTVCAAPEMRSQGPGKQSVCTFRLATTEIWAGKHKDRKEHTEQHSIVVFGNQGERCHRTLVRGSRVHVTGRIRTRTWTDAAGTTRWAQEILGDQVTFIDAPSSAAPDAPDDGDVGANIEHEAETHG